MKNITAIVKTFFLTVVLSVFLPAMDVATYYDIDIESMKISLEGSQKVLALLKSGAPLQEQYSVDDELQKKLNILFEKYGTTPSMHAGFYMKHQKEVQDFYEHDSTLQDEYIRLKKQLEEANKQIATIREEQEQ